MSDGETGRAPRRPATARPRADAGAGQAPSAAELGLIERQRARLSEQAGATLVEDDRLGVTWVRFGRGPALDYATAIDWSPDETPTRLAALAGSMRADGAWPTIVIDETTRERVAFTQLLAGAGWQRVGSERTMYARHPAVVPHLDPDLRVEAVTPASAGESVRLETLVFGLPPEQITVRTERLAESVRAGQVRAFLLRLVREPLAGARLTPGAGAAAITAVAVAPRHRRRGYGRMVTAVALRAGLATGHALVWLSVEETNAPALSLYRSLGFAPAFAWSRWIAPA
jgi:[ribosomal protein S18]-alanine N-acetyltransferase